MKLTIHCWILLLGLIACSKPQEELREPAQLSDLTDSVIYDDLKFGIQRDQFLQRFSSESQQNIMSEPKFGRDVVEVEGKIDIRNHHFDVYYYFDMQDSLYRVKGECRVEDKREFEVVSIMIAQMLYIPYGIPEKRPTIKGWYKFSWNLNNKQVMLECGCFMQNCLVDVTITEIRLFAKNRRRGVL